MSAQIRKWIPGKTSLIRIKLENPREKETYTTIFALLMLCFPMFSQQESTLNVNPSLNSSIQEIQYTPPITTAHFSTWA